MFTASTKHDPKWLQGSLHKEAHTHTPRSRFISDTQNSTLTLYGTKNNKKKHVHTHTSDISSACIFGNSKPHTHTPPPHPRRPPQPAAVPPAALSTHPPQAYTRRFNTPDFCRPPPPSPSPPPPPPPPHSLATAPANMPAMMGARGSRISREVVLRPPLLLRFQSGADCRSHRCFTVPL